MLRVLTVLAALAAAPACAADPAPRAAFGALEHLESGAPVPEALHGVWQSRGYGWIFDIHAGGIRQYQDAGGLCFPTSDDMLGATDTLSLTYDYYRLGSTADEAILQLLPDDTEIRLERIEAVPPRCTRAYLWTRSDTFEYFAAVIGEHYAFFEERNIDWPARVATARAELDRIETDAQLFDLLASMIDGFSDSHTKLLAEIEGVARRQQDGLGPTLSLVREQGFENPWLIGIFTTMMDEVLDPGYQFVGNDRILWGTIDGRVGYIQILQMGGFSGTDIGAPEFRAAEFAAFDAIMDEALTAMADMDAVIIDLSNNRGGYDAISRRLAGRFTDTAFDAYTTEVPGSGIPPRTRIVEPAAGVRFTGPVVVLTSDVTVSGGEIATLALRALPNVTHMGETTRGSFSTVHSKPLPNGWVVELSNEVIAAPDGTSFEETGIPPDLMLEVFPADALVEGHAAAIAAVMERVTR